MSDRPFHDFRQWHMDPISDTVCAAKWYNATIYLWKGTTVSCHHPSPHQIPVEELATNPSAIHNTSYKKQMRQMMLNGQRPDECQYCWRVEDMGKEYISDRVYQTIKYDWQKDIATLKEVGADADVALRTVELAFDRTCNFACSYCNASYSTTWTKDIKKNGPYRDLVTSHGQSYRFDGVHGDLSHNADNPYVKAFWDWWPELSKGLQELRITGGEPLMSDEVWKLFDMYEQQDIGHIKFTINSNLGAKPALIQKLIEKSHHVEKFDIFTSCEATWQQAEFIRDGLDYQYWMDNVELLVEQGNINQIHFMMTIGALSLFTLTELVEQVLKWKEKYNTVHPRGPIGGMSFNLIRYPAFHSVHVLPEEMLLEHASYFRTFLEKHKHNKYFRDFEQESFLRLIEYLETVRSLPDPTLSVNQIQQDFKSFFDQYQERRGLNISVFPRHFVKWYEGLKTKKVIPIGVVK